MNATDVIAYTQDGSVICPKCITDVNDETGVWFADDADGLRGATCGDCSALYTPDNGWDRFPLVADYYRWATCNKCNAQAPFARTDTDARLNARRNVLQCRGCHGSMRFTVSR